MTEFNTIDEALEQPEEATSLWLDFKKLEGFPAGVERLVNLEALHMRNCPAPLEVPEAVGDLKKLKRLRFDGAKDVRVQIPRVFYRLPVERLEAWDTDPDQVIGFKGLKRLYIVVKDPKIDVVLLAEHLTALEYLELWGSHLKKGQLPPEIGRFSNLTRLDLVSCGLEDFPDELAELENLRELEIRGLPMETFPAAITKLKNLERLQFKQKVPSLPTELTELTKLRILDLGGALNKGTLDAGDEPPPKYLKPLPKVLGDMKSLVELRLDQCGVIDVEPLTGLKGLTVLSLQYSGLSELDGLAALAGLEELRLDTSYRVRDLAPLAKLKKLRKLDIQSCRVKDLSPILELTNLKELNISYCSRIEDLSPVMDHPGLESLEADDEIVERWNRREEIKNLPKPEDIKKELTSDDLGVIERAFTHLAQYVEFFSTDDTNAIFSVLGLDQDEMDETEVLEVDELDGALERFGDKLSTDALADLVASTFRQVENNFAATVAAVGKLAESGATAAQKRVVEVFKKACEYYDAGHRYWEETVHDQFIEELFPKFQPEPLADLLEWCGTDALNSDGGDAMDELFVPAFAKASEAEAEIEGRLVDIFKKYFEEAQEYMGGEYFKDLIGRILEGASDGAKSALSDLVEDAGKMAAVQADLKGDDAAKFEERIRQIGVEITAEEARKLDMAILDGFRKHEGSFEAKETYATFLLLEKESTYLKGELSFRMAREDWDRFQAWSEKLVKDHPDLVAQLVGALADAVQTAHDKEGGQDLLPGLREAHNKLSGQEPAEALRAEITKCLGRALNRFSPHRDDPEKLYRAFDLLEQLDEKLKLGSMDGMFHLTLAITEMVKAGQNDAVCRIVRSYPKLDLSKGSAELLIANSLVAAINGGDQEAIDILIDQVPEKVTNEILAYNLACLFATRGDKPNMLKAIRRSLDLGKTRQQFLDDTDFAAYTEDEEFLLAIAEEEE